VISFWRNVLVTGALGAVVGLVIAKLASTKSAPASAPPGTPPATRPVVEPPPGPLASCPPSESRLALIGDSYAVGIGLYLQQLSEECGTAYYRYAAVEGSGVRKWDQPLWVGNQLDAAKPTAMLISLGGNDFRDRDPVEILAHINGLLDKIRAAGCRPLWISPPTTPFPDELGVRQMWQQRMGDDWFDSTKLQIPRVQGDPLGHPTEVGYKLWADAIWIWMSNRLRST